MIDHLSQDRLVDLLSAIDQPGVPVLDHLASCMECRAEIVTIERVREMIGAEEPLPAGFVDRIMNKIETTTVPASAMNAAASPSPAQEVREGRSPRSRVLSGINTALVALLAGVAACVVLLAMTSAATAAAFTPLSLFMVLLAGMALTAYRLTSLRDPLDATRMPLDEPNF